MSGKTNILLIGILFSAIGIASFSCKEKNTKDGSITIIKDTLQKSSDNSLVYNLTQVKDLSRFTSMLTTADMMDILQTPGPFTVFAPSNNAFESLSEAEQTKWNTPQKSELASMLGSYIVAGSMTTKELHDGDKLMTLSGKELLVSIKDSALLINGKPIFSRDIQSNNGIIHIVDGVLFPF